MARKHNMTQQMAVIILHRSVFNQINLKRFLSRGTTKGSWIRWWKRIWNAVKQSHPLAWRYSKVLKINSSTCQWRCHDSDVGVSKRVSMVLTFCSDMPLWKCVWLNTTKRLSSGASPKVVAWGQHVSGSSSEPRDGFDWHCKHWTVDVHLTPAKVCLLWNAMVPVTQCN